MKDTMKPCHHTLSEDIVYKEVVIIGNGPSGMVTSYMLAGNVPHLKTVPDSLPIDEMLKARLSNIPVGQSLYETDLMQLAEGLEGRSQNPIPLLMDNLLRPCADLGIQADPLIEWKFDVDKQIEHVVLGRGPAGGAWHSFPSEVRTLSPAAWLSLPPHATLQPPGSYPPASRVPARAVAAYCRQYVRLCNLQRYFRSGVVVSSVTRAPMTGGCESRGCPLNARFCVCGYEVSTGLVFRYWCSRVVVACGGGDRATCLVPPLPLAPLSHLHHVADAVQRVARDKSGSILVVGSGVSAADAVVLSRAAGLPVYHVHRAPAAALAKLSPHLYPDYCQVYKMMCDGSNGDYVNYTSLPEHAILDVSSLNVLGDPPPPLNKDDPLDDTHVAPKKVKLLNLVTNEIKEITTHIVAVLIGSKPDLHFLQSNFNMNFINVQEKGCHKCSRNKLKGNMNKETKCFLKDHWTYLKCFIGQGIQSCKSRYLNYTEINGNTDTNGKMLPADECNCDVLDKLEECDCKEVSTINNNPYSDGIGFGIDDKKPVDCRANPLAIDKVTHEMLNAPKGMYALGPVTADNFVRFIPGGALSIVASIHKEHKVAE